MASQAKRCLYEVLGVSQACTTAEIRSAYKKLALQRHPDKLVQSGVPEDEATAAFQELVNAYEVLSDPRERSWYDSNRSKILFSSSNSDSYGYSKFESVPNLFPFFSNSVYYGFSDTGKGFYKVYADLFDKVYRNELNYAKKLGLSSPKEAPLMGNMKSPRDQVTAFYNYWLGFATVMDFCWADQYDVMAGMNRKLRRLMEDDNMKLRKKARREYNETVRGLAEFVKKRDKRVIDMQARRNAEMEKKREEEQARKKELERLKAEKAKKYKEPDWAQVDEVEDEAAAAWDKESDEKEEEGNEFYCIVCGKKFKSEKQWKNHEQSKKHKERIAALREALSDEDKLCADIEVNERRKEEEQKSPESEENSYFSATDDAVDELAEQFGFQGNIDDQDAEPSSDVPDPDESDETSFLEAMVSGHRSRKHMGFSHHSEMTNDDNDLHFMEYNNTKVTGRKKGARKRQNRRAKDGTSFDDETDEVKDTVNDERADNEVKPTCTLGDENADTLDPSLPRKKDDGHEDGSSDMVEDIPRQAAMGKKANKKKDNGNKSMNASKGRKEKASSKRSDSACEKCGEEFDSRTKLHKHLGETGHSSLKSR